MTILATDRLELRPWELGDFDALHALTASDEMRRFLGSFVPVEEDSYNRLLRNAGCWQLLGWGPFKALERDTGEIIGNIGLFSGRRGLGPEFDPYPEAGWIVRHDRWGRGYATEAMRAVLHWFELRHGGGRTVCMIAPGNTGSERTAAKLGYRAMGPGTYKDEEVMRYVREG